MRHSSYLMISLITLAASGLLLGLWHFRDQSLAERQRDGTIRIGYAIEPPYALLKPGGQVSGVFPEVARQLTSELGIQQVEWIQADFDALIPGLEAGRFDVIAAGMYITRERAQRVAFSEPLLHVQQGLLVRAGNPLELSSYQEAVSRPEVRLAVIAGAVEEGLLRRIGVPEGQIVVVPDASTGRAAVENGVADGLALSSPTICIMAARDELGQTTVAQPFEQPDPAFAQGNGYAAFAFRMADRQLLAAWNIALRSFVGSPEHLQLMVEFGLSEAESPGSITTAEILSP
ncbi:MAG: ectoine/hydroxyectoine ABC transporter substrate-binding protein EhuB [Oscillochloris sp.]|nr:ectoine/hydroxyectoine ABC transporter substrate-binding protein EhuB [Oscillochloris sp.]